MSTPTVWYSHYQLPGITGKDATGALLRIGEGYGVITPWTQFGDLDISAQLESIKAGYPTPLAARTLHYLQLDEQARIAKKNLFKDNTVIRSHTLLPDISALENFDASNATIIKVKIGGNLHTTASVLNNFSKCFSTQLRLDANAKFSFLEFCELWNLLSSECKAGIDFIEDPCPYIPSEWTTLSDLNVPLAYDFYGDMNVGESYRIRVIKPQVQTVDQIVTSEIKRSRHICVTSALDHPLGISIAAFEYQRLSSASPLSFVTPGITSFTAYQKDEFSERISKDIDLFQAATGTGFGFDDLLEKLKWQKL